MQVSGLFRYAARLHLYIEYMGIPTLKSSIGTLRSGLSTLSGSPAGAWRSGKQSASARGYGYAWQKARAGYLEKHPLCECPDCQAGIKRTTMASVVNHRVPHRGNMSSTDPNGFWNRANWEAMSTECHNKRTQEELKPGWVPPPRLQLQARQD